MAKITQIHVSGKVGKLVCFDRYGKSYTRTQAEDVQLTEATIKSAATFGIAVKVAKFLRQGLSSAYPKIPARRGEYRLASATGKLLDQIQQDKGSSLANPVALFNLAVNPKIRLSERLRVKLDIDWSQPGTVMLSFPALNPAKDIVAPAKTQTLHWQAAVAGSTVDSPMITGGHNMSFELAYDNTDLPARSVALPFTVQPGTVNAVLVTLRYTVMGKRNPQLKKAQEWQPADIVGALYQAPENVPLKPKATKPKRAKAKLKRKR